MNRPIPTPGALENQSGKWVQRVPKSIHLRLVNRAKEEGVSLNTLVIMMLSESLSSGALANNQLGVLTNTPKTNRRMQSLIHKRNS